MSVCASNSQPSSCMNSCMSQFGSNLGCEPYVPPSHVVDTLFLSSDSGFDFSALLASNDALMFTLVGVCFLFSFLFGFSAGSRQ